MTVKAIRAINTSRGFTLVEVLMAMSLLSVMVALLFGTLKISADSWESGEKKITDVNEIAVVYNFFQRHLVDSKPLLDDFTEPGVSALAFQGDVQSLRFVSHFPASAERAGAQLFTVKYQDEVEPASLVVGISPFYPLVEGVQRPKEEVTLIKGVSRFELAYFGESPETGQIAWQDHWHGQETLPKMVRVKISLAKGGFWPAMVFPIKISDTAVFFNLGGAGGGENEEEEGGAMDADEDDGQDMMDEDLGADEE